LKEIFAPSLKFLRIDLSGSVIFPTTLTGEYGLISPFLPIGVGPKNRHIAFPFGQYATSLRSTKAFAFSSD